MKGLRRISVLVLSLAAVITASAQARIIPREQLEAMANPRHSADSAWLQFDSKVIAAEPMKDNDAPHVFRYVMKNAGPEAVEIKRLTSTCSCAVAVCDKRTVKPGEQAVITVTYDPKGHPGRFERRIFIYTQEGMSPAAILKLSVTVERSDRFADLFKFEMGGIRLRRSEVAFRPDGKAVERIPFVNVSGAPLKLQCDEAMLPACLGFSAEPELLEDGEEGEIIISFDPEKGVVRETMPVILKGLGVSPSRSAITVKILK